jgi:hypothetical protein
MAGVDAAVPAFGPLPPASSPPGLTRWFIGSQDGLGHSVFEAQQLFDMPRMYATIFAAGALGYGLNLLFLLIERRFVHWSGK